MYGCFGAPHPCSASRLFGRHPCLQLVSVTLCRVRVLVRLSHPRPPDRHQRVYRGCPAGTHPCAPDAQAVRHRSQSANSCCAELCCVAVSGGASSTSSCGLSRPYVLLCVLSQRFFFFLKKKTRNVFLRLYLELKSFRVQKSFLSSRKHVSFLVGAFFNRFPSLPF